VGTPYGMTEMNETGVRGGNADERMDADNSTIGRGADGDTQAREALRVDLGERSTEAGQETGDPGIGADEATPPEL
jgi:hypothetical protein